MSSSDSDEMSRSAFVEDEAEEAESEEEEEEEGEPHGISLEESEQESDEEEEDEEDEEEEQTQTKQIAQELSVESNFEEFSVKNAVIDFKYFALLYLNTRITSQQSEVYNTSDVDVMDDDTEVWLIKTPKDFDTSLLNKQVKLSRPNALNEVARLNENYVLSLSNPGESRKLINVFPSSSHERLLLGKPFTRNFNIIERVELPQIPQQAVKKQPQQQEKLPELKVRFLPIGCVDTKKKKKTKVTAEDEIDDLLREGSDDDFLNTAVDSEEEIKLTKKDKKKHSTPKQSHKHSRDETALESPTSRPKKKRKKEKKEKKERE